MGLLINVKIDESLGDFWSEKCSKRTKKAVEYVACGMPIRCSKAPEFLPQYRRGCDPSLAQYRRETLHILYRVYLGDERGEALGPLPPEHGIDQQVEFVGDFVERQRVFW